MPMFPASIRRSSYPSAFSLIELLVVIGIITIMLSLLMPTLADARDRGRAAECASNLRQLTVAALLYVEDDPFHRFPYASFPVDPLELPSLDPQDSWVYTLKRYVDPHTLAVCGSDTSPHWTQERPLMPGRLREVSYGVNSVLVHFHSGLWRPTPSFDFDINGVARPSNTIAYGELPETGRLAIADWILPASWTEEAQGACGVVSSALTRHHGRPNWSFLDGHVEPLALEGVYDLGSYNPNLETGEWKTNKFHPNIAR